MQDLVKIVVFVPEDHADLVREAMGKAGAGKIGNYSYCSFSTRGKGRFRPEAGSDSYIGEVGSLETVEEERIEVACERGQVGSIVQAIKAVHPYEEVVIDMYPMLVLDNSEE